jgi:hypothetical protein
MVNAGGRLLENGCGGIVKVWAGARLPDGRCRRTLGMAPAKLGGCIAGPGDAGWLNGGWLDGGWLDGGSATSGALIVGGLAGV